EATPLTGSMPEMSKPSNSDPAPKLSANSLSPSKILFPLSSSTPKFLKLNQLGPFPDTQNQSPAANSPFSDLLKTLTSPSSLLHTQTGFFPSTSNETLGSVGPGLTSRATW
ncbi:hypothetical protein TorRG33x02_081000, partial [Trema orientale]